MAETNDEYEQVVGDEEGGDAGTKLDSIDQRWLRYEVLEEIEQVMRKHKVGGVVFVVSKESAAWRYVLPKWSGLRREGAHLRARWSGKTPEGRETADVTMHYVGALRDMTGQCALMHMKLWDLLVGQLRSTGGSVEHSIMQLGKTGTKIPKS